MSVEWANVSRSLSYAAEGGAYWLVDMVAQLGISSVSVSSIMFADGSGPVGNLLHTIIINRQKILQNLLNL